MSNQQLPFAEGGSINRPPLFCGENYPFWKVRMQIFMESVDRGIWKIVESGYSAPVHRVEGRIVEKPYDLWSADEVKHGAWDSKAKNIIHSALNMDEFFRISACKTAKEMWDHIQVVHEGTDDVKRSRKNTLIQEYETFRMIKGESIGDVQKRFTHIVNHLKGLGKQFDEEEMNVKVLKALDRTWQAKVTAISESKNLSTMRNEELFGRLREYEMDLQRLSIDEEKDRKQKGLALKSTAAADSTGESEEDDEAMTLIVQKFRKFMKKENSSKPKFRNQKMFKAKKGEASTSTTFTCYECGKPGHIKTDCPNLNKKQKNVEKKSFEKKKKRAYIAWEDNASSTSTSDTESEEEANLCLMANDDDDGSASEVSCSSSNSVDQNDFDELLLAFNELHAEARKISKLNKSLKSQIKTHVENCKALEEKVSGLEKEKNALKTEIETFSSKASIDCSDRPCEQCKVHSEKLKILENALAKFSKGKSDLDDLLGYQRGLNERGGLGYVPNRKKSQKKKKKSFQKGKAKAPSSRVTCHYCLRSGHSSFECHVRKFAVPQGHCVWVKKTATNAPNPPGPKTVWVPKIA